MEDLTNKRKNANITIGLANKIRDEYVKSERKLTYSELAEKFNVSISTVRNILKGEWKGFNDN